MPLLELGGVAARYGGLQALRGIDLSVDEGEIVAVLGANGAGKTTTLRAISATVKTTGDLVFAGKRLPRRPEAVARAGIAHVPEGRGTFAQLSVDENLRVGAHVRRDQRQTVLVVNNLSRFVQPVELDMRHYSGWTPIEVFGEKEMSREFRVTRSGTINYYFLGEITADLDRPTRGMIRVPDTALTDQLASMEVPPAAAAPRSP